jgi:hypothetical protein
MVNVVGSKNLLRRLVEGLNKGKENVDDRG